MNINDHGMKTVTPMDANVPLTFSFVGASLKQMQNAARTTSPIDIRLRSESIEPRERMIMEMRFGLCGRAEKTQKEVADLLGISQSYISRLEKRIIRRLREELQDVIFS